MSTKPYEDDSNLTAYALGELEPDEARAVETQLADDAEARAYIEELRVTGQRLTQALRSEGASQASPPAGREPAARGAEAAPAHVGAPLNGEDGALRIRSVRWHRALALAASLAVAGLVGWSLLSPSENGGEAARSIALFDGDRAEPAAPSMAKQGAPAAFVDAERLQRLQQPQNEQDEAERREVVAQLKLNAMQAVEDKNFPAALEAANQLLVIDPQNEYARGTQPLLNDRVMLMNQQGYVDRFQNEKAGTFAKGQDALPGDVLRYPEQPFDDADRSMRERQAGTDSARREAVTRLQQDMREAQATGNTDAAKELADQIETIQPGAASVAPAAPGGAAQPQQTPAATASPRPMPEKKLMGAAGRDETLPAEAAEGGGAGGLGGGGGGGFGGAGRGIEADGDGVVDGVQRSPQALGVEPKDDAGLFGRFRQDFNTEQYDRVVDNPFKRVADEALSTFSVDVDTASYSNMRRFLSGGQLPPPDAVRIEELLNYFDYNYAPPATESQHPFAASVAVAEAPWNPQHRLVRIGIKGKEIPQAERPASNLVFLIDVSGSMQPQNKLPLVKRSMRMLAEQLDERDRVAIVVYAGRSGLVLPSTSGAQRDHITGALDKLDAGGSTNGAQGIQLAYQVAQQNLIKGGINRVILCTDGDFNIGVTDRGQLTRLIEEQARSGVYLSILGFGMDNLKDATLEELTNKGEGNYGYIDTEHEARKLLVEQMQGTLQAIAKDVKIQVEFNPAEVGSYRLIGYENRILAKEDFNDDTKDAGDIGAGHEVTALYEVVPVEVQAKSNEEGVAQLRKIEKNYLEIQAVAGQTTDGRVPHEAELAAVRAEIEALSKNELAPPVDESKYQSKRNLTAAAETGELLTVKLRYKGPEAPKEQGTSTLIEFPAKDEPRPLAEMDEDFRFAASVAGFGMLLRDSPYKGTLTWAGLDEMTREIENLGFAQLREEGQRRVEFRDLVEKAAAIAGRHAPAR